MTNTTSLWRTAALAILAASLSVVAPAGADDDVGEDCVPVSLKIGVGPDGSCAVRDYTVGDVGFQEAFYPWTSLDGSLFNCEAIGPLMTLVHPVLWPDGLTMPTSLAGEILEGTVGDLYVDGGQIYCAGHQHTFNQPFLMLNLPFLRLQNVSVMRFDVPRSRASNMTVHVAFTGAGIMHIEDPETFHIGASTAGAIVGMVAEAGNRVFVRERADGHIQVQGHIFEPDDPMPGMITGHICDSGLADLVGWDPEDDDAEE